jgi:two-component system nitrate/nitrite response regulator NarL
MTENRVVAPRHLFLSESGELLPRWEQAFPKASAARPDGAGFKGKPPELIWLRLRQSEPAAAQIAAMRARFGQSTFIVLSDIPDDQEAMVAFGAAARGYCNSHAAPEVLRQAALVVAQGGIWIGEALMRRLVAVADKVPAKVPAGDGIGDDDWAAPLTDRERQVADTIAGGYSNKEIARRLGITERTVKAHVGAIFEKLQVRDRLQLALLINGHQKSE